jgi:hypothetical protein
MEAQAQGLNPWDNEEELTELIELYKCLDEVEVVRIAEVGQLAFLVGDIPKALEDLHMLPIPRIPQD